MHGVHIIDLIPAAVQHRVRVVQRSTDGNQNAESGLGLLSIVASGIIPSPGSLFHDTTFIDVLNYQ